jgi:hypothetical protein
MITTDTDSLYIYIYIYLFIYDLFDDVSASTNIQRRMRA